MLNLKYGTAPSGALLLQGGTSMAGMRTRREWTNEDNRTLKMLARQKTGAAGVARKLKRTVGATYQQAYKLGVSFR
jgi:hypothetical protein